MGRRCHAGGHVGHNASDADPEGHDESSQQAHNGTLPRDNTFSCHDASPNKSSHQFPELMGRDLPSHFLGPPLYITVEPDGSLTGGLAQGKNIPRQKSPSSGPPTMPKMLSAACGGQGWAGGRTFRLRDPQPHQCRAEHSHLPMPQHPTYQICQYLLPGNIMQHSRGRILGMLQECTLGCPLRLFPRWL